MKKPQTIFSVLLAMLIASGLLSCDRAFRAMGDEPGSSGSTTSEVDRSAGDNAQETKQIQEHVRTMMSALYMDEVDNVIEAVSELTHPKIIEMAGGTSQLKALLKDAMAKIRSVDMKQESMTFPEPPTFLSTDDNEYVVVPTLQIVAVNGQRVRS